MQRTLTKEDYVEHTPHVPYQPMTVHELICELQKLQNFIGSEDIVVINRIPSFNPSISKVSLEDVWLMDSDTFESNSTAHGTAIVLR